MFFQFGGDGAGNGPFGGSGDGVGAFRGSGIEAMVD